MARSEWLEGALAQVDDVQLKRVLVELFPLLDSEEVWSGTAGELADRLAEQPEGQRAVVILIPPDG